MFDLEVYECEFCGRKTYNDDCECDECKKEQLLNIATIDTAIEYGEDEKQCIELNGFLAWIFGAEKIERILRDALTESDLEYAESFCMDDWMAFSDWYERRTA
jgi:hypothetical protein